MKTERMSKMKNKTDIYDDTYYAGSDSYRYRDYEHSENIQINYQMLLKLILKKKTKGKFLELGCAYGFLLKMAANYFETYGTDISSFAIEKAKKYSPSSKLVVADVETELDKCFDRTFDVIVAHDVLEHLKNPREVISKCYSLLNEDGYFYIRVPNTSHITVKVLTILGRKEKWVNYQDKSHFSVLDLQEWKTQLNEAKFNYEIFPRIPTETVKKIVFKLTGNAFIPACFYFLNETVIFQCTKKR